MKRDALRRYLASLVLAALPGCCNGGSTTHTTVRIDAGELADVDGGLTEKQPLPYEKCSEICHNGGDPCSVSELDAGTPAVDCTQFNETRCPAFGAGGRPPAGLQPVAPVECDDPLGTYFAHMAHVEGAAVFGFEQLARELESLGAPRDLIVAAREAAADEKRHERIARRLARDYGAMPQSIVVDPTPARSAVEIALDNATEGGVFETFAVLVTMWQAKTASDRRVRAAFTQIADDEVRHAELAEAISKWLEPRLSIDERSQVAAARSEAAARLAQMMESGFDERLIEVGGLPPPRIAKQWVAEMTDQLWTLTA